MRCSRTLHKEQDLVHAGVDEFIDEAGAGLRTADNGLTGFYELFHGVGSAHRQLFFETLDDVLVSRRRLAFGEFNLVQRGITLVRMKRSTGVDATDSVSV